MQDGHDRVADDQAQNKGNNERDRKAHTLKKPGGLSVGRGPVHAVAVEEDDQYDSDINRGDGLRTGDDRREQDSRDQQRARLSGEGILPAGEQPQDEHEAAEIIAGDDDGTAAGKFPDLTDDRIGDERAGGNRIEQHAFPLSVDEIEQTGKGRSCQHQKAAGQKLVQKRNTVSEGKYFFPQDGSPAELRQPDGLVNVFEGCKIIGADGAVEHGEAEGTEGVKKQGDPIGLPACDFFGEIFYKSIHGVFPFGGRIKAGR